ncbi:unnamed protein product [Paramecium octaurelia]|uniref:Uncharacterized protein n=1 Tax=Paramecium octaurelia TaxID=43137 RepID=A0A8S1XFU2_PAROT|nr:unnamed protein product [Paramecium octaurelia]
MEIFKCRYLNHENEEIIGFCLNDCKNATQYCYQCLTGIHSDHENDCIRFVTMSQYIQEYIQINNNYSMQIKEIVNQLKNCLEQLQTKMDQDIAILKNINYSFVNKEYLKFKQQINIIKTYYSKEKEKEIQQQIIDLKKYLETIKSLQLVQNQGIEQVNPGNVDKIQIKENNEENEQQQQIIIQEAKILFNQGNINYQNFHLLIDGRKR